MKEIIGQKSSYDPVSKRLMRLYETLFLFFGPQHWWPGETAFEVMVGAVLTQNTNWKNVERAIANLKERGLLDPVRLNKLDQKELAELIRPAGYYNIKAKRLKNLLSTVNEKFEGDLNQIFSLDTESLRQVLLSVKGIGKETADSIILYAAKKPIFVVDSYTYRVLSRHNIIPEESTYEDIQELFHTHLERDERLYNEYHALIVKLCKTYCLKEPKCRDCPIKDL